MRFEGDLGTVRSCGMTVHVQQVTFERGEEWIIYIFRNGDDILGKKFRCPSLLVENSLSWLVERLEQIGDEGELSCEQEGSRYGSHCRECVRQCRYIGLWLAERLDNEYASFLGELKRQGDRAPVAFP